ncbi:MAG TPA: hypothetical protein V6D12_17215 [Candidatus Obscuribacterales bacterium]
MLDLATLTRLHSPINTLELEVAPGLPNRGFNPKCNDIGGVLKPCPTCDRLEDFYFLEDKYNSVLQPSLCLTCTTLIP